MAMYNEANGLEPSLRHRAPHRRAGGASRVSAAAGRVPRDSRAPAITRGDLAALIGIRLEPLLATVAGAAGRDYRHAESLGAHWIMTATAAPA